MCFFGSFLWDFSSWSWFVWSPRSFMIILWHMLLRRSWEISAWETVWSYSEPFAGLFQQEENGRADFTYHQRRCHRRKCRVRRRHRHVPSAVHDHYLSGYGLRYVFQSRAYSLYHGAFGCLADGDDRQEIAQTCKRIRKKWLQSLYLLETISGVRVVKAFSMEDEEVERSPK